MEFEDLGAHCQHEDCKQRDFLPFKCDTCGKSLCLLHRSYAGHGCGGGKQKDMTSMDCPICGKGVKFDKLQDPNAVWEEHYLHSCTQQATQPKAVVHCFAPQCRKVLGPSNTFTCGKCHQRVCLSHRIPEEHSCVGHIRDSFLRQVQKNTVVGNAEKVKKDNHMRPVGMFMTAQSKAAEKDKAKASAQSHHHTAPSTSAAHHPPAPPPAKAAPPPPLQSASLQCPFCGLGHDSDASLIGHITAFHPDDGSAPHVAMPLPPAPPPAAASTHSKNTAPAPSQNQAAYREVCPTCQQRFPDAIALVRHFESSHSEHSAQAAQQNTAPAGGKTGGDCSIA